MSNPSGEAHDDGSIAPEVTVIDSGEPSPHPAGSPADVTRPPSRKIVSTISGKRFRPRDLIKVETLRPSLLDCIKRDFPELPDDAMISVTELARYRMKHLEDLLQQEHGEFSALDREVAESIARQDTIAEDTEHQFSEALTLGDRMSDRLASFGGSWRFLIFFGMAMAVWMAINVITGQGRAFDPYPFILLNLVLSCVAAIQAPIIMMSQRRLEVKDRLRADNDYRVNLKAELEIRHLHEKLDYLISKQWKRLAEIQQMQMELMQENRKR
ncbi:MAG: DUF1003 domain-containing protein [Devosia sp.]